MITKLRKGLGGHIIGKIGFTDGRGRWGKEQEDQVRKVSKNRAEGEYSGRDSWNRWAFEGRYGDLVQCKLSKIYQSNPNDGNKESQLAISCHQRRLLLGELCCIQLSCWPRQTLNNPGYC